MPLSQRITTFILAAASLAAHTQSYTNPVLFSDDSDPDAIRDSVASSSEFLPGLPLRDPGHLDIDWVHVEPR